MSVSATSSVPDREEGESFTRHQPSGDVMTVFHAAERYRAEGRPVRGGRRPQLRVAALPRDWAAKGTLLLGIRAVIAESFERIHRSNLVGMGILPLQFPPGMTRHTLGLTGDETFDLPNIAVSLVPGASVPVQLKPRLRSVGNDRQPDLARRHATQGSRTGCAAAACCPMS